MTKIKRILAASVAALGLVAWGSAAQAGVRVVEGQAYWTGDPGPVTPGPFWEGGQYRFDPHHYMSWYGDDPQDYRMVVHASHSGSARCVWRKRVVNSNWEFQHPFLLVCD